MKKLLAVFAIILITLVVIVTVSIIENNKNINKIKRYNLQYEHYLEKEIYGTDVISIINKATNENIKNNIEKDEKGSFIENDSNSIKVEIKLYNEENLITYSMELINKAGIEGFVRGFNLIHFKCTNMEYHEKTKRIKKIVFEQIKE